MLRTAPIVIVFVLLLTLTAPLSAALPGPEATGSFGSNGTAQTNGAVRPPPGGLPAVNIAWHFYSIFEVDDPSSFAELSWSYTSGTPATDVIEILAYSQSSSSIGAISFTSNNFAKTGQNLGTFDVVTIGDTVSTGSISAALSALLTANPTHTHFGFEFRSLSGLHTINPASLQLNFAQDPTADIALANYSINSAGTVAPAISATGTTDGSTPPGASNVRWTVDSGSSVTLGSTNLTPTVSLADLINAGLATTIDSATLALTIDADGNFIATTTDQASDTATINYSNSGPTVNSLTKTADFSAAISSVGITHSITDADAALNGTDLNGATAGGVVPTNFEQFQYSYTLDGVAAGTFNAGSGTNPIVPGATISRTDALAQGLAPNSTVSVQLGITDRANAAGNNSLVISYTNALPSVSGVTKASDGLGGLDISATTTDADLAVAFATFNEQLTVQAFVTNGTTNTQVGSNVVLEANGTPSFNISAAALTGYLSSGFLNYFFRATDTSGAVANSALFPLQSLAIPEPTTIAIWSLLAFAAIGYVVRRKR